MTALSEYPARLPQLKIKDFKLGTPMRRNDAIDASRNNRWTFGSALAHYARVYLMLRRRSALRGTRRGVHAAALPPVNAWLSGAFNLAHDVHLFGAEPQQAATV